MDYTLFPNFVLLGDFNIDYNNTSHPFHHHLLGFMSTLCLTQVVSEPTRLSSHSSTLIDLVLLSQPPLLISCHTVPPLANLTSYAVHQTLPSLAEVGLACETSPFTRPSFHFSLSNFPKERDAEGLGTRLHCARYAGALQGVVTAIGAVVTAATGVKIF